MKLTFFSNYLNHHQLPFCQKMVRLFGDDFRFVATTPFNQSRLQNGYADMNAMYDFVVRSYESQQQYGMAMDLAIHSDVIVIGSAPETFLLQRLLKNPKALTFRYSERLYKETEGRINYKELSFYRTFLANKLTGRKNLCLLAASAYTPYDYVRSGFNRNRIYKWGYFPPVSTKTLEQLLEQKSGRMQLIWVGRLIDWKHPEQAVEAARMLRDAGFDFELKIIGSGPLMEQLTQLIADYRLQDIVTCTGGLPAALVRAEMEKSHIHLFTSDYNEGWGAVLNESMASACAPVCHISVGAAPFLIEHGKTGFLYNYNDTEGLYGAVKVLIENPSLLRKTQINAYYQIDHNWNAVMAAQNLKLLSENLLQGKTACPIEYGPCSKAAYIRQDNFYKHLVKGENDGVIDSANE